MKRCCQNLTQILVLFVTRARTRTVLCNVMLGFFYTITSAEDIVIVSTAADPTVSTRKTGDILDYDGQQLRLRAVTGVELTIPSERVIDVQTSLTPNHQKADHFFTTQQFEKAAERYQQAQTEEPRIWMRRQIIAQQIWCSQHLKQYDLAAELFLVLVQSDPHTQYINTIPLAWRAQQPSATLAHRAISWLEKHLNTDNRAFKKRDAIATLIGASWLLPTSRRDECVSALEQLQQHADPIIAHLSEAQLWRTKIVTATPGEVQAWQTTLSQWPSDIRAGPYFIVGQVLSRHERYQEAALMWMRIPIFYPQQRTLVGDCLLAAGNALEKMGHTEEARSAYHEIVRDYAELSVAQLAKSKIESLHNSSD